MSFHLLPSDLLFYCVVAIVFVLMISVLVFAHELGHYVFARLFGMGVEEFAIGFGPKPIAIYHRRTYTMPVADHEDPSLPRSHDDPDSVPSPARFADKLEGGGTQGGSETTRELIEGPDGLQLRETTLFTVRPLPLGGFVRIKGMLPEEDGSETRIPGGFYSKAPWKRIIVLFAGPMFSVLAGILVLVPVYMIDGIEKPDLRPILGTVVKGKPADLAHLITGDVITSIAGKPITRFYDIVKIVRDSPDVDLKVSYLRKGTPYVTTLRPERATEDSYVMDENLRQSPEQRKQAKMGAAPRFILTHPGIGAAVVQAVQAPIDTVQGLVQIARKPSSFGDNVNGPARMVRLTSEVVQEGVVRVMTLMALLSISVGVFNLLPAPPLDGGQIAIAIAEMVRGGRRLSLQVQSFVSLAGMALVVLIMGSAVYADVKSFSAPTTKAIPAKPPVSTRTRAPANR